MVKQTEAQFQQTVIMFAQLRGWLVHHTRPALRQSGGWSTPIQGNRGFPDLVLARNGTVLFVELKSATGRLSVDQKSWLEAIGIQFRLWRPADWDAIKETLT